MASPIIWTINRRRLSDSQFDEGFLRHLIRNGVFPDGYECPEQGDGEHSRAPIPPGNLAEIREMLVQPCPSWLADRLTDSEFGQFKRHEAHATRESQVKECVQRFIEVGIPDGACVSGGAVFTNIGHLTDGTLCAPKPDLFYGCRSEQLDPRVCHELCEVIVPSIEEDLPILPNFFMNIKGPEVPPDIALRQALYDGAVGERGMTALRYFIYDNPETVCDNCAYTISETYHAGQLKIYAIHTIPGPVDEVPRNGTCSMTQVKAYAMTGGLEEYRAGVTAHINAREWTRQHRDRLIALANRKIRGDVIEEPGT